MKRFALLWIVFIAVVQYQPLHAQRKYNIRDFGAKGNSKTLNTTFINEALKTCSSKGGGTVVIPKGVFLTGTILLQNNTTLHLEEGAVLKGSDNLNDYLTVSDFNKEDHYYKVRRANWNKSLILGDQVNNVALTGDGTIDGSHIEDSQGEENMRGPHILFLSRSSNITVSGIRFTRASNYAFMSYDIRNVLFSNIIMEEGWDGIHIRGGRNIQIRDSRFYTGDDAIAGGLWENMVIDNCYLNSSCNGIRVIMPVTGMEVTNCRFEGPGKYPHRTSGELQRRNMLTGLIVQPGGWFPAPGEVKDVTVSGCYFENLDNPIQFTLNTGNNASGIYVNNITGKNVLQAAASFESWNGGYIKDLHLSDIALEYVGKDDPSLLDIIPAKPRTDYRQLPCWGLFLRNVNRVELKNVNLTYTGHEIRPVIYLDNTGEALFERVNYPETSAPDPVVQINSGKIQELP